MHRDSHEASNHSDTIADMADTISSPDYFNVSDTPDYLDYNGSLINTTTVLTYVEEGNSDSTSHTIISIPHNVSNFSSMLDYLGETDLPNTRHSDRGSTVDFFATTSFSPQPSNITGKPDYVDDTWGSYSTEDSIGEEALNFTTTDSDQNSLSIVTTITTTTTTTTLYYEGDNEVSDHGRSTSSDVSSFLTHRTELHFPNITTIADYSTDTGLTTIPGGNNSDAPHSVIHSTELHFPNITTTADYSSDTGLTAITGGNNSDAPHSVIHNTPFRFPNITTSSDYVSDDAFPSSTEVSSNDDAIFSFVTSSTPGKKATDFLDILTNRSTSRSSTLFDFLHPTATVTDYNPPEAPLTLDPTLNMNDWTSRSGGFGWVAGDKITDMPHAHEGGEVSSWGAVPVPEDVWRLHMVSYGVMLPLVVLVGVVVSCVGLVLLSRKKLKSRAANPYYKLLIWSDLLILLVSIPTAITLNGCRLYSYNVALYLAHVSFTLFYMLQVFTLYIILWISYDRFLALWSFRRFYLAQKPRVLYIRVVFTVVVCVGIHLKHLIDVEVNCLPSGTSLMQVLDESANVSGSGAQGILGSGANIIFSDSDPYLTLQHVSPVSPMENSTVVLSNNINDSARILAQSKVTSRYTCTDGGFWVINDGLHYLSRKQLWQQVFWTVRGLVTLIIPIVLVLVFNVGIIAGVVHRRLHNNAATARTRGQAYSSIYITLTISFTFLVCTMPITIHAAYYAQNIDNCYGPYPEEVFRSVANLLLMCEHLSHFLFLSFNETFRTELKSFLQAARTRIVSTVRQCIPTSRCIGLPAGGKGIKKSPSSPHLPAGDISPNSPLFVISPPEEIRVEKEDRDPDKDSGDSSIPLSYMLPTTLPESLLEAQGPPSRASMVTVEIEI